MKQQIFGRWIPGLFTNAFLPLTQGAGTFGSNVEADVIVRMPAAGTIRNLRVRLTSALVTGGHQVVFTTRKNSSDTAQTVTITVATGVANVTDSSNSVHYDAGDTITIKANGGGVAPTRTAIFSLEWEPDVADTSIYTFGGVDDGLHATNTQYDGVLAGGRHYETATQIDVVAVAGNLTELNMSLSTAPGSGKSRAFTIMKNGVAQDGTGGTVNASMTIADAATTGSVSFTLPLAPGDRLAVRHVPTGSPAASNGCGATAFVSSSANKWNACGHGLTTPSQASVNFAMPIGDQHSGGWDATETVFEHDSSATTFSLSGLRVALLNPPNTGNSWQFTLRLNNADSAQTVTLSDAEVVKAFGAGSEVELTSGDLFSMESTPTSTPDSVGNYSWAFVGSTDPPSIVGAFVAGADGTVTSTHTALFNVDGVTRVVHAPNTFNVGGPLVLHKMTTPPTPLADAAILFAQDNGGKIEVLIQYPTGSPIQVSIEA